MLNLQLIHHRASLKRWRPQEFSCTRQDENQPWGATGGGGEGASGSAAWGRCFPCTMGQLVLPEPPSPALHPVLAAAGCVLQTNASCMLTCTCLAPSRTCLAHSHLKHLHTRLSPASLLVWYQAFLQHLQEKNLTVKWRTFVSCKSSPGHVGRQCSGRKKTN